MIVEHRSYPSFSLWLACVEDMVFTIYGKKLNVERNVQYLITFMSIDPKETIKLFKACGGKKMMESFNNLKPGDTWTQYF